jgi:hypothetical protein
VLDIASTNLDESAPDVVYDPHNNVFLVVYISGACGGDPWECEDEVKGILIEEPDLNGPSRVEIPEAPNEFTVASQVSNGFSAGFPVVAYNKEDRQYMVAFLGCDIDQPADYYVLFGQMLESDSELPKILGPAEGFLITGAMDLYWGLDIAWSYKSSTFLLVTVITDSDNPDFQTYSNIVARWLHDTYQDGASQDIGGWQIAPRYPLSKFCYEPQVAYDPSSDSFTVVFEYDVKGDDWDDLTLYGQRLTGEYKHPDYPFLGEPFSIASDLSMYNPYYSAFISYAGSKDTMFVAYAARKPIPGPENDQLIILLRSLNGSKVGPAASVYDGKGGDENYVRAVATSKPEHSIIVWNHVPLSGNDGIYARRIGPQNLTYLPNILKE